MFYNIKREQTNKVHKDLTNPTTQYSHTTPVDIFIHVFFVKYPYNFLDSKRVLTFSFSFATFLR